MTNDGPPREELYTGETTQDTGEAAQPRAPEGTAEGRRLRGRLDGGDVELEWSAVGLVHANKVELEKAAAAVVFARGDVTIEQGGARTLVTTGSLSVTQGGAGMILAGGETTISQGGAGSLVVFGNAHIEQGGAVLLLTPSATLGQGARVGIAISPRLEVGEGAQVLAGPRQLVLGAMAVIGFGLLASFVTGLRRR